MNKNSLLRASANHYQSLRTPFNTFSHKIGTLPISFSFASLRFYFFECSLPMLLPTYSSRANLRPSGAAPPPETSPRAPPSSSPSLEASG